MASAMGLGGLIGFGHYWVESSSSSGIALTTYFDVDAAQNFSVTPTVNIWSGSEEGIGILDLCPGVGLKMKFPAGTVIPFLGINPEFHFFFIEGLTLTRFGLRGLGGLDVLLAEHLALPVQFSFGKFFYKNGNTNVFTAKIGVKIKL